MHISLINPATGQQRFLKVGFSWTLCLFSWLYGIPLFIRGLPLHGGLMFLLGIMAAATSGEPPQALVGLLMIGATIFYGIQGNELTLKHLLAKGWVRADGVGAPTGPIVPAQPLAAASAATSAAVPDEGNTESQEDKVCPRCAETVKAAAAVCRHCGYTFTAPVPLHPVQPVSSGTNVLKIFGIIAAVLVGIVIVGAIVGPPKGDAAKLLGTEEPGSMMEESAPPPVPALSVTAQEMYRDYDANEQAAQLKYGGQPVEVSGTIATIELDILDEPMISLEAGPFFEQVTLHFDGTFSASAAKLRKGQWFVARCNKVTELMGLPQLEHCTMLTQVSANQPAPAQQQGLQHAVAFGGDVASSVQARNPCAANALAVDLGFDTNGGSFEIMTPVADTDGKHPYRVSARPVICVTADQLRTWIDRAGAISPGTTFEVTYDPSGSPQRMRSQYDYNVMMCEELPYAKKPPADLMLGHFEWSPESRVNALRVIWERDFRDYLERTCF